MTKRPHLYRPAGVALAATLALTSTSVLAQVAAEAAPAPVMTAPQTAPVMAAPAPTIVVPDVTAPVPDTSATVQAIPEPAPSASTTVATPRPTTSAATPVAPVRRATTVTPAERSPIQTIDAPTPSSQPAAEPIAAAPVTVDPVAPAAAETTTPRNDSDTFALLATLLGAAAVLGLALWGFLAICRRKRPDERLAVPVVERPVVAEPKPVAPVASTTPIAPQPIIAARPLTTASPSLGHSGASVPLPRTLPESFEERDALLRRMIDAKPDRANPFTDRRARLRRARLILQSLGRDFGDSKPWIDLSQYPGNWPELARQDNAAA